MSAAPTREPITGPARTELAARLRADYEAGASIRALARRIERSYSATHLLLGSAGTELRPRGGRRRRPAGE